MGTPKAYSRKEISRILAKASEIQTAKDLFEDQLGLNEDELIHVAEEVGISKESLNEALLTFESPDLSEPFNWLRGTSRLQNISIVQGELTDLQWEKVIQEIRKITGGIGKTRKFGSTFEWEQRRKEIGYKHISLSQENDKTRIQIVSSWNGVRRFTFMFSFLIPFVLTAIGLDGTNFGDVPALLISMGGGTLGVPFGMMFLNNYFNKQKKQIKYLLSGISKIMRKNSGTSDIIIEDEEVYKQHTTSDSSSGSVKSGS
jgi:hypothetical protein